MYSQLNIEFYIIFLYEIKVFLTNYIYIYPFITDKLPIIFNISLLLLIIDISTICNDRIRYIYDEYSHIYITISQYNIICNVMPNYNIYRYIWP